MKMSSIRTCLALTGAIAAGLACTAASAAEVSYSGYGTVGYAQSDQSYNYQRFINNSGTFARDSVFGAQMDVKFSDQWGATVQAKVAPSLSSDNQWDGSISWAFLSYRPSNDWLFRLGKLRVPLYLNSENMDVGVTYDFTRLPAEVFSIAPTNDFTGVALSKNWSLDTSEISLDGYWGQADTYWRLFMRDDLSAMGGASRGAMFVPITVDSKGLVLTAQTEENRFRAGVHSVQATRTDGTPFATDFPYENLTAAYGVPAYGYQAQGATVPTKSSIGNLTYTLGADIALGSGFRMMGEYARRIVTDTKIGPDTTGTYLALLKQVGGWTPYVSYARLLSSSTQRDLYTAVNGHIVTSAYLPTTTTAALTASQRAAADAIVAYDQHTVALGTSYKISPTQIVKAEWARTHVGAMSSFVDAPAGADTGRRDINVYSVSYNFVF